MKTSISHLPESKQNEIMRIADIIREVANPEMIILYGSYAKGSYVEHRYRTDDIDYEYISDYDFLIVTKSEPEELFKMENSIMDRVDRYNPPVNLEIYSIDHINEGLGWGQYFFKEIIDDGIRLYDSTAFHFTKPRELSKAEQREKASSYLEVLSSSAKRFLALAEFGYNTALKKDDKLYEAVFNLHQSTESLYFAVLLVFTAYKPKLHNLWKLRNKTKKYSEELFLVFKPENNKTEQELFDLLKRAYIDARYKQSGYHITFEDMKELIDRVALMISIVEKLCLKHIQSLS